MHSFIEISDSETKYSKLKPLGFQKDNSFLKKSYLSLLKSFITLNSFMLHNENSPSLLPPTLFAYLSWKLLFYKFLFFNLVRFTVAYYLLMFLSKCGRINDSFNQICMRYYFPSQTFRLTRVKIQTDLDQHFLHFWFGDIMDEYRLNLNHF